MNAKQSQGSGIGGDHRILSTLFVLRRESDAAIKGEKE